MRCRLGLWAFMVGLAGLVGATGIVVVMIAWWYIPPRPLFYDLFTDEKTLWYGRWYPAIPLVDGAGHVAFIDTVSNFVVVAPRPMPAGSGTVLLLGDANPAEAKILIGTQYEQWVRRCENTVLVIAADNTKAQFTIKSGTASELYESAAQEQTLSGYGRLCQHLQTTVVPNQRDEFARWVTAR